ncbi:MAG: sulfatase activating formylglycine-generating enzyme [Arenicella sp.]|jgi:formylglycine-generating enzyme required for sulfatase activity
MTVVGFFNGASKPMRVWPMTKLDQLSNAALNPADYQAPTGAVETTRFSLSRGHWILIIVGLLCVIFISFITLARSIQINIVTPNVSKPDQLLLVPSSLQLGSWLKLPIGNRILVLPGKHSLVASASGYQTTSQSIEVLLDRQQKFDIVLTPLPGQLEIKLEPAIEAKLFLNGIDFGDLPGLISEVPAGQHELTVDAPLYRPASRSIAVQGRGLTENLAIELVPAWANLNLSSIPAGATVLIDDIPVGNTPLQIKVEEGVHTLALRAEKFKPSTQEFTVFAQQDLTVKDIALIPADGILTIVTKPDRAAVILNGEYQGVSPLTLNVKPDQSQQLQVYRAGFRLASQQITLEPEQQQEKQINLSQDVASIKFSLSPNDAVLYIDGVRRGVGSQTLNLNTLPHKVVVQKDGYVSYQNTIIPTKSSAQIVSVRLLTKNEHFWANVPDNYTTVEGQAMTLFKSPGIVIMGSSRRETGRRSNEASYTAKLEKHLYVSLNEVSNKQFRVFNPAHNSGNYKRKSLDSGKHPVANVSWQQAALYCNWLSKREKLNPFYQTKSGYVSGHNANANGYRLLSEVEWAWLARNKDGQVLTYPWGANPAPGSSPVGNFADTNATEIIAFTLSDYDDGYKASSPIGRFAANHRGLFDIGGNVSEWTNDWYSANNERAANPGSPLIDPLGPDEGEFHVIRGGSWARGHIPQLRLAYRDFGAKGKHDVGFRIARYAGQSQ